MQRQRCPDSKTKIRGVAYSWERLGDGEKEAILASIRGASAPPPPRVVEISWQDRCNIDCFFCSTSEIRAGNFELPVTLGLHRAGAARAPPFNLPDAMTARSTLWSKIVSNLIRFTSTGLSWQ